MPGVPPGGDDLATALIVAAVPTTLAIYRFGSSLGEPSPESDIDLAVLAERPLAPLARFDLQERLASALHRQVDLVDLRSATTVMASQVVTTGLLLHDADPAQRGAFEDYTYSAYARLNEERRAILERVTSEGTVYGR